MKVKNSNINKIRDSEQYKKECKEYYENTQYQFEIGDHFENAISSGVIIDYGITKNYKNWNNRAYILHCDNCDVDYIQTEVNLRNKHLCPYCVNVEVLPGLNDLWTTDPHVAQWLKYPEEGHHINRETHKKYLLKCPDCGYEIANKEIRQCVHRPLLCPRCGDHISFPNKFIYKILEYYNINFISEYNFNFNNKRYDVYIPDYSCIVEMHGKQHYTDGNWPNRTLKQEQKNDMEKQIFAQQQGIQYYITINCYGDIPKIIQNVVSSSLFDVLNIQPDINTLNEIAITAQKSMFLKTIELWNSGVHKLVDIAYKVHLKPWCVEQYLKRGAELHLCDYKPCQGRRKVKNITTGQYYDSIADASRDTGVNAPDITTCCKGRIKHAGKTEKGTPMEWTYV